MLQEKMRIILFVRYFQRAVELVLIIDHVFLIFDKSSRYQKPNIHLASIREGVKKTKKKVVILLQPPSIYLPLLVYRRQLFYFVFGYFEMMFKPLLESEFF